MRRVLTLAAFLASLLLLAVFLPSGCGRSEKSEVGREEEVVSETEQETAGGVEAAEKEQPKEEAEVEEGKASEKEAESMPFSSEGQSIGSGEKPGLVITDVRWSDHGDYYRIVFEIHRTDGTDTASLPTTQTWYGSVDQPRILIFFLGVEVSDTQFDELGEEVYLGDSHVTAVKRQMGASAMETTFAITTSEPSRHYLHYVTGPMRVILDIEK